MRTATLASSLAGASVVLAQASTEPPTAPPPITPSGIDISPEQIAQYALGLLSNSCRTTVEQIFNSSSPLYTCLQIDTLLPAINANDSLIPYVDDYLADVCYSNPCSTATLNDTANQISESCSTDLELFGFDTQAIYDLVGLYPLAREIACLKTTSPDYSNVSASINTTAYNTTNGTFCITELATDLSAYLGANLTNQYLDTVALGGNITALQLLANISASEICDECIFAAITLVETEYPQIGNYPVADNKTANEWLQGTCPGMSVNSNGTLPTNITVSAVNSTFPETVIAGNATFTPNADAIPAPTADASDMSRLESLAGMTMTSGATAAAAATKRAVGGMEEKKRWIGQW